MKGRRFLAICGTCGNELLAAGTEGEAEATAAEHRREHGHEVCVVLEEKKIEDDEIVNYQDIKESLELILSSYKPKLTDAEIDGILDSLDDAVGNNCEELILGEDIELVH
ncbi:hypothetical protein AKJ41_02095 [candidate division MSBL1 archaeon SCGC-AAA259O05]|uniref:Uncharacterized protein n=1 Tax=candidate division MSBL1 archaeon SCGC-AAA259O05 TaxID=1698271 RepID=A0A133V4A1_9EURY|nr:hypothetical protein AKJ41_02095 [candidate division MSBL1 archaeon SCGC-AAA259O05]